MMFSSPRFSGGGALLKLLPPKYNKASYTFDNINQSLTIRNWMTRKRVDKKGG